jgi:endonuclease-3
MNEVSPPTYAGPPPGSPQQVTAIIAGLRRLYPDAKTSLNFSNPLELLVATQLSAQSTDERVNRVTAELFKKYRRVEDYATVSQEELEQDIRSTGFYHSKAKNIRAAAQCIMANYGGEAPRRMEDLITLPGVGRKTCAGYLVHPFRKKSFEKRETKEKRRVNGKREQASFLGKDAVVRCASVPGRGLRGARH